MAELNRFDFPEADVPLVRELLEKKGKGKTGDFKREQENRHSCVLL
jgi:hypothetical protein